MILPLCFMTQKLIFLRVLKICSLCITLIKQVKSCHIDRKRFIEYYQGYSLIRIMQAMGAYGFRGFYEKKSHFLQSIPYASENLKYIIDNIDMPVKIPVLIDVLNKISKSETIKSISVQNNILKVSINSFSYKRSIPTDNTGNGGGFVFDCRGIYNPGRKDKFKTLTGKDEEIISYLDKSA